VNVLKNFPIPLDIKSILLDVSSQSTSWEEPVVNTDLLAVTIVRNVEKRFFLWFG
jgi:hypothetical protein